MVPIPAHPSGAFGWKGWDLQPLHSDGRVVIDFYGHHSILFPYDNSALHVEHDNLLAHN